MLVHNGAEIIHEKSCLAIVQQLVAQINLMIVSRVLNTYWGKGESADNSPMDKNELEPKDGSVPNSAVQQHLNILNPIAITDVYLNRIWTIPSVAQQELQTSCMRINADFIRG